MKIYLFRHGETYWNEKGKFQGLADIELNENGLKQAKQNAELLRDFGIEYIYSSPLKRALKTAQILAEKIDVKIEVINDLKECDIGDMVGKTRFDFEEIMGTENCKKWNEGDLTIAYPNGESRLELRNRAVEAMDYIFKNCKYNTIGIASHNGVIRQLLEYFGSEDCNHLSNCEIIDMDYNDGNVIVNRRIKNNI